ncbi:N-acetyl-ornithine/N-acetyl-lysine deacetylase [Halorhabdus utahensis DSM 12940]|uniref:Putative [LysW]-lysine/[LysW]-ornithine hydrolase n=1 Tax=Halorhabdus utahensis (strain DSM 12940 / JCM 11049 / AX-2) TaxID=519442 RepID=C7NP86_HALUD|nr:[LysW]-lysine hydrolase [Halorhabdus utahensis]ACV11673.1 N-acetyl-ornithine/N-acetyl-lysine deacetylase [Halorhabdus utahensis DSM 12940]
MSATRVPTADVSTEDARELLIDLVEIPSVSGDVEDAAAELAAFFESHGREVWIDDVGNVRAPADDGVLLTSHIDTVPGDIPVRLEENEDGETVLWGRGSVDAKGSLAAMAAVAVRTGASFAGVVGEEVDSTGGRYLVEDREIEPDAVINGEPSGWDGITLGYRGLLGGTYVATSESGHSSRPDNNAIEDAIDWWNRVEAEFAKDEWHPVFERVTCKPVDIDGGVSSDGLSVETTMRVQLRVPPEYTTDEIRELADGHLDRGTVNWDDWVEPVMTSPRTGVARAFRAAIREEGGDPRLLRKTGTADMNIYADAWDVEIVSYGPGDSDLDHAPDEHLPLPEFDRSVAVLDDVTTRLLEEP